MILERIISGGQTGADRAGLETAKALGITTGGTAPKHYMTEDGPDPSLKDFGLVESPYTGYTNRTRQNVEDADLTVIFGQMSGGSATTIRECLAVCKPYLSNPTPETLASHINHRHVRVLNVAGNRRSKNPKVATQVAQVLTQTVALLRTVDQVLGS